LLQQTFTETAQQFPSTCGCSQLLGHKTSNLLCTTRDFTQLHTTQIYNPRQLATYLYTVGL